MRIRLTKEVLLPDNIKLARYIKTPELGPRTLFFSGGTALKEICRDLIRYTHNSIHIITTFDSGGSSAKLRDAFKMPAIGDIRARLMALAEQSFQGNPEVYNLFTYRLSKARSQHNLLGELEGMTKGKHRLIKPLPDPMRKIIRHHLKLFMDDMPLEFDLRGASIGNLVLTAGYTENLRHMDPIIYIYSRLAEVRGVVRPVLNRCLHLVAELEDGSVLVGQHNISGKETPAIASPIKRLWLSDDKTTPREIIPKSRKKLTELIGTAELICYPMGSFYSSLIVNFLVSGVSDAILANRSPKVYIPSTGIDPECKGLDINDQIYLLLSYLQKGSKTKDTVPRDFLDFIIIDNDATHYRGRLNLDRLKKWGIQVLKTPLVTRQSNPKLDPLLLSKILLSLT